jgi:capsular exopolysaccharide synthesis family protein
VLYANTFAAEYIAFRREADRATLHEAQVLVRDRLARLSPRQREGQQGRLLESQHQRLSILASLQTGNAELVQPASVPDAPSSPKPRRNGVLGGVLGLLLGVGLVFLLERLDRRIKDPEELRATFNLPLLGAVPTSAALAREGADAELPLSDAEAFRMLRARLRYFNVDRNVRSVLITSAAPAEGKTTVAVNLAAAAAASGGGRVLLLEADLRRPTIAKRLGIEAQPGLAEALTHDIDLDLAIQHVPVGKDRSSTLDVMVAGALPPNPTELIESLKMASVFADLAQAYDLVVIDTPPTAVVADTMPMVGRVDGVLVVGAVGRTTRDAAGHLRDQLRQLNAPILGVVANRLSPSTGGYYGYGYGYGYGPKLEDTVSRA